MSPIYEKIKNQIAELPDDEQYDLYTGLRERFEPGVHQGSDSAVDDAEWEADIESRLSGVFANGWFS